MCKRIQIYVDVSINTFLLEMTKYYNFNNFEMLHVWPAVFDYTWRIDNFNFVITIGRFLWIAKSQP